MREVSDSEIHLKCETLLLEVALLSVRMKGRRRQSPEPVWTLCQLGQRNDEGLIRESTVAGLDRLGMEAAWTSGAEVEPIPDGFNRDSAQAGSGEHALPIRHLWINQHLAVYKAFTHTH